MNPHLPTNLVTEDYDYAGAFDNAPAPGAFMGEGGEWSVGDGVTHWGTNPLNAEHNWLNDLLDASPTSRYGKDRGWQCDHCGARIRYVAVLTHTPTGDHIAVGETCLDQRFSLATADFQRLRKASAEARAEHRIKNAIDAFFANNGDDLREILWPPADGAHYILHDLNTKLRRYGELSEGQVALARKIHRESIERAAARAAEEAETKVPVPVGKALEITGTVLSTKWQESYFAYGERTLKMLVKVTTDDGTYKLWGTCPNSLSNPDKGDVIKFVANVERSDDDESFGFFKRPRKAECLGNVHTPLGITRENEVNA